MEIQSCLESVPPAVKKGALPMLITTFVVSLLLATTSIVLLIPGVGTLSQAACIGMLATGTTFGLISILSLLLIRKQRPVPPAPRVVYNFKTIEEVHAALSQATKIQSRKEHDNEIILIYSAVLHMTLSKKEFQAVALPVIAKIKDDALRNKTQSSCLEISKALN